MMKKFARQRGLVDQYALMSKRILVSGSADGVAELLVMLRQLGVGESQPGCIGLVTTETMPNSVFWKLMYGEYDSWEDWLASLTNSSCFNLLSQDEIIPDEWDIHLTLQSTSSFEPIADLDLLGNVNGLVKGLRGVVKPASSITHMDWSIHNSIACGCDSSTWKDGSNPLHSSLHTMVAATVVHEALKVMGVSNSVPVSDVWHTVTCRIETTDLELARSLVKGVGGEPLDVSVSQDGLATIARYRSPIDFGVDAFDLIQKEMQAYELSDCIDVGFIPWDSEIKDLGCQVTDEAVVKSLKPSEISILGVGGLGSWATPLICEALPEGTVQIIDGDDEIAIHNLNRQVLYSEQDIGLAKATAATERLRKLFPHLNFNSFNTFLRRAHIGEMNDEGVDLNDFFSDNEELVESEVDVDERLRIALNSSDICLGCLDNMQARTILNESAIKSGIPMINGGGESIHGIVERLHDEGCMICRYGPEAANAAEIISCTEEGARPITSIVTTTAFVGAMMAAVTILELSGSKIHHGMRYSWVDGVFSQDSVSKPPWYDEPCIRHN
jgi:molybdopterin/thiamine biosynthesis adenylyltransferase